MSGVIITNEQIFAELRDVSDKVTTFGGKLDSLVLVGADHETRIRALEKRVWIAAGAAGTAGACVVQAVNTLMGG